MSVTSKKTPAAARKLKEKYLAEVYQLLCVFLGTPPQRFNWQFKNEKKQFQSFPSLTPKSFVKNHLPYAYQNKVCLIHSPTKDKPFHHCFTIQYLGNLQEGRSVKYINVPLKEFKQWTIDSLEAGEGVWFGSDVGKFFHRKLGVLDLDLYDHSLLFGTSIQMDKAQRLDHRQSQMSHAMLFTGVDCVKGKPKKWRVENSWGEEGGDKGYLTMTDSWFDEYVFEVVLDRKYLPKSVVKILDQKPIVLPPWDPMGSCLL